jgi:hypothetical protein
VKVFLIVIWSMSMNAWYLCQHWGYRHQWENNMSLVREEK